MPNMPQQRGICYSWSELITDNSKIGRWSCAFIVMQFKKLFFPFLAFQPPSPRCILWTHTRSVGLRVYPGPVKAKVALWGCTVEMDPHLCRLLVSLLFVWGVGSLQAIFSGEKNLLCWQSCSISKGTQSNRCLHKTKPFFFAEKTPFLCLWRPSGANIQKKHHQGPYVFMTRVASKEREATCNGFCSSFSMRAGRVFALCMYRSWGVFSLHWQPSAPGFWVAYPRWDRRRSMRANRRHWNRHGSLRLRGALLLL